jgi:hypothetical protein
MYGRHRGQWREIMGAKKSAATIAVKGKGVDSSFILRIISVCCSSAWNSGYVGGSKGSMGVGDLYDLFDSDALVYLLATIVLLSGVILLVPMFIRVFPRKSSRSA